MNTNEQTVASYKPRSGKKTSRLLRAITLHGFWKFRWYHGVLIWLMLAAYAWGASPYFMAYVVGMPEPGTAPRYTGTVRMQGELQATKSGWKPPKYFIKTDKGEVEFHCGYKPQQAECGRFHRSMFQENPSDIYEIGYSPYWGVDFIKYPPRFAHLNEDSLPKYVTSGRLSKLNRHLGDLWSLFWGLSLYLLLVWFAYKLSADNGDDSILILGFWRVQKKTRPNSEQIPSTSTASTESLASQTVSTPDTNPVKPPQSK